MLNFGNRDTEFPVPNYVARVRGVPEVKRKKKIVTIVAMALPKMGGKKCGSEIWGE